MKQKKYSMGLKVASGLLQAVLVGILTACVLTMTYWLDGSFDIGELGRRFEDTDAFLVQAEDTIRRKINCTRNLTFFQTDGETDLQKKIDIRQYVSNVQDEANQNENMTYRIEDLLAFYPYAADMEAALSELLLSSDAQQRTWDGLTAITAGMEKVLPLSGRTLADSARLSNRPYDTLLEYYRALCQTSRDVYWRYQSYCQELENPEGSSHEDAPSNLRYYVENSVNKQSYSNMGAGSVSQARDIIASDDNLIFLFDGVRSMAIMVANSENTLSEAVAAKFIDAVFLGSNERVVIAVDPAYPAGDELHEAYMAYEHREPQVIFAMMTGVISMAVLLLLFTRSIVTTGRSGPDTLIPLSGFDLVPSEIAAGLCVLAGLLWYFASRAVLHRWAAGERRNAWIVFSISMTYLLFLLSVLSLARRVKWKKLWKNSVLYTIYQVSSQIMAARVTSGRILIAYLLIIILNILVPHYYHMPGLVVVLILDLAVLLYLLRDQVGKLSVREGLREISKGKLDYRIDTRSLTGDSLEMAEAVNEMGVGLQEAVDSMVRSERLKAELITNVSHDLKTPLTSIINYVGLLSREVTEEGKAREYVDILDRKSQRLKVLVSDLIEASRISSGNVELDMTDLDFRQMLLMAEAEFEERFEERSLTTVLKTGREKVTIRADGSQLWRVLENLLGNIAKYARDSSKVLITLKKEGSEAVALFENESEAELVKSGEELEERFVRGDLSRGSEGSGLGLSIAKNLTQMMDGEFTVTTEAHRFTARVSFPLAEEPAAENAAGNKD